MDQRENETGATKSGSDDATAQPKLGTMWRVFGRIGVLSFGGPAAQIALMQSELVQRHRWLTEAQFLRALSFCMLLPGPEAMQLATYAGWRLRGITGGLLAGTLFVAPGAIVIAVLAYAYLAYGDLPAVRAVFVGVQATVVVIVIAALWRLLSKVANGPVSILLAGGAFMALFAFGLPFPLVIAAAALIGSVALPRPASAPASPPRLKQTVRTLIIGMLIWGAPLAVAGALGAGFLLDLGLYFSKLALVSFGGAYAGLAYMAQTVVQDAGWINTTQMVDALGLAETTPGPLILVTQLIAMLAGAGHGHAGLALLAGAMALWMTFVPSFLWIFAGAPLIDWISGQPRLQAALQGITAAVVGVIGNLSLWFAIHVFFADVDEVAAGPLTFLWPTVATLQVTPLLLAGVAGVLLLWRRWALPTVLGANTLIALVAYLATQA